MSQGRPRGEPTHYRPPPPAPPAGRGALGPLRVGAFGPADAGKTSLLAALAQVQKEAPSLLGGELADASGLLDRQRHLVYDERAEPTDDPAAYPVAYRP